MKVLKQILLESLLNLILEFFFPKFKFLFFHEENIFL